MTIRAAIFDLDDTLYLERDYVHSGYRAVAGCLKTRIPESRLFDFLWSRFQRGQAAGAFEALSAEFSLNLSPAEIAQLVKVYREHRPTIEPIPGMAELLSRLHPEFVLGLLADGFLPAQRLKLEALGLERFFDAIVFTEELGRDKWKPSPAGFELMMERIGNRDLGFGIRVPKTDIDSLKPETRNPNPASFAYISDNPSKDFLAPNRLGWRTIQWLYPGQVHAHLPAPEGGLPQFVAHSPGEIVQILRS